MRDRKSDSQPILIGSLPTFLNHRFGMDIIVFLKTISITNGNITPLHHQSDFFYHSSNRF